jgi:sugar fermentation stimulation protein A
MDLKQNFSEGILLKRYKRFLADIQIDEKIITVHVPNTGSMKSCNEPGSPCLFSTHNDPSRKIPYTLEAIKANNTWVGVNTSWPNKLAVECFNQKFFDHWKKFDRYQTEVKISKESRIDLVLWSSTDITEQKLKTSYFTDQDFLKKNTSASPSNHSLHLVEIKNVTLKEGESAMFPDAVTERGQKHLRELMHFMDLGMTAEMLYVIQRDDCNKFQPAWNIDPVYSQLLLEAKTKGLIITPLVVSINHTQITPQKIISAEILATL